MLSRQGRSFSYKGAPCDVTHVQVIVNVLIASFINKADLKRMNRKHSLKYERAAMKKPVVGVKISKVCLEALKIASIFSANINPKTSKCSEQVTENDKTDIPNGQTSRAQICVKLLSGEAIMIDVDLNGTGNDLKSEVNRRTGLELDMCRFTCGKTCISNELSLSESGVTAHSTVHIVLRLRGGMNRQHGQAAECAGDAAEEATKKVAEYAGDAAEEAKNKVAPQKSTGGDTRSPEKIALALERKLEREEKKNAENVRNHAMQDRLI